MRSVDVAIVGGGLAGTSLAYHLAEHGATVVVLERGEAVGGHASGRNARLVMRSFAQPLLRALTTASAAAYRARAAEVGFQVSGSLLLGREVELEIRRANTADDRLLGAGEARALVPLLAADPSLAAALHTPGDGVLDPLRLLAWYRREAERRGARFALAVEVCSGASDGHGWSLATSAGPLGAGTVVIAAGAWAVETGVALGGVALPLRAAKRHLFVLGRQLPVEQPFVWDLARELYLRPDPQGTLVCACDDEPPQAFAETVSAGAEERMRRAFAAWLPALAQAPLVRAWACLRTHSPDGLPVIGPDPRQAGLWWVAALGGFGLGASWELGRLAAAGIARGEREVPAEVLPARFARA